VSSDAGLDERLQVLEAVTDSALTSLGLDAVLVKLLEQVVGLLRVDTAAVLLVERGSDELVATAALGIEEEVWQGVRVRIGQGFAGQVVVRRRPVVLNRVDHSTVINPLLWEKGIRTMLGVPMVVRDEVLGVLHVGSLTPRRFTDTDTELLQLVGDRLALAVHAQLAIAERAATSALQRSLLPGRLPTVPDLEFAARYVPGASTGVGGDWYDVFELSGGRLGIAIGDVAGHGLTAAVIMGRVRSALRAYALDSADPGAVLSKLDRQASHFERGTMVTIGYAVVDPSVGELRLSLAGHLPPVLAVPDRPAAFVDVPVGPPVGFGLATGHRRSGSVELPPGGVIAFYTDGLVERRDKPLDDGLALLRESIITGAPEAVCARVMKAMVGMRPAQDDVALLVMRRTAARDHRAGAGSRFFSR
jgi:putative methionine-R-sulfoxide reductase with GAF domain